MVFCLREKLEISPWDYFPVGNDVSRKPKIFFYLQGKKKIARNFCFSVEQPEKHLTLLWLTTVQLYKVLILNQYLWTAVTLFSCDNKISCSEMYSCLSKKKKKEECNVWKASHRDLHLGHNILSSTQPKTVNRHRHMLLHSMINHQL